MHPKKKIVLDLAALSRACRINREKGKTIVLTSGCFDLLHGGHLHYLCDAAELGFLVVGINSDRSVRKLKGDGRPVRGEEDRAFTMAGFSPVRLVAIFDDDCALIAAVRPNVYVASATSRIRVWDDAERVALLKKLGTRIMEIDSKKQDSTTDMIKRAART